MNKILTSILCIFLISCSSNNFNSERKDATEHTKKKMKN